MAEQDPSKEAQIRAKQAISPAGLADQSAEGHSGPGSETELRDAPSSALEDEYLENDEDQKVGANVHQLHPNRNPNDKPDLDKPAYA